MQHILKIVLLFLLLLAAGTHGFALSVTELRTEHLKNPIGVSFQEPRFSWHIEAGQSVVVQTAYQIIVRAEGEEVWNSGKVVSDQSHLVAYQGKSIRGRTRYYWKVQVWDNYENQSMYSDEAFFETGILDLSTWEAQWVGAAPEEKPREKNPVEYYRHELSLKGPVKRARMYVTADGLYKAYINGEKVGDQELTPGWTSYEKRLQYQVYDVSEALVKGSNCLAVMLADGWHRGRINYRGKDDPFKNDLRLLLQLEVEYENGKKQVFGTDETWKVHQGGLLESTLYDGEVFDAGLEPKGWKEVQFNDKKWSNCSPLLLGKERLVASHAPAVRVHERLEALSVVALNEQTALVDFGQNLTGRVAIEIEVNGPAEVLILHGEALDAEGSLYTENLRGAMARVLFKAPKKGRYSYTPHFTFMGFRYVTVQGIDVDQIKDIRAEVLHSDLDVTGSFECSDADVNRLYQNIVWSQKGNFLDVPTDCPQRDERMGWTGDAQVFATTAAYNMHVAAFFNKWLADLAADQTEEGAVPWVIPNVFAQKKPPATGWADAAVIVPWQMYQQYGDQRILETQYPSMKAWVDYMEARAEKGLWVGERHFGDWLSYQPNKQPQIQAAVTENDLLAAIYFQYSTKLLAQTAKVLGKVEDTRYYSNVYTRANDAFLQEFVTANGRLVSGTQTAYALVLAYALLPVSMRKDAMARLVANVNRYGHLTTGFLGVSQLNEVLSANGEQALAYQLLLRREYPSWLYPVSQGATTIWERWDGKREDGSFQEAYLNSMNHYAYGAIGQWMVERMAGIQRGAASVGYKTFVLAPQISDSLDYVRATYQSNYGWIRSAWQHDAKGDVLLALEIPANTKAMVHCPSGYQIVSVVSEEFGTPTPMNFFQAISPVLSLGSGVYTLQLQRLAQY